MILYVGLFMVHIKTVPAKDTVFWDVIPCRMITIC
jgi:hypothetical protein